MAGGGSRDKKMQKIGPLTDDLWPNGRPVEESVDQFIGVGNLKRPSRVISLTVLLHSLKTLHIPASRDHFGLDFGLIEGFGVDLGTLWARVSFWKGFQIWVLLLSDHAPQAWIQPHFCASKLQVGLHSLSFGFSLISVHFLHFSFLGWLLGERQAPPGLRASTLLSHLSLSKQRLAERWGMTRPSSVLSKTISDTSKSSPKGKSSWG